MKTFPPEVDEPVTRLEDIGHAFRGAFFDRCCTVESWATEMLASSVVKPKARYLFGQKLDAVRNAAKASLAGSGEPRFKRPDRVLVLLDRFRPYAELRASLAHSVQSIRFGANGEVIFMFRPIGRSAAMALALAEAAQRRILADVTALAKELSDQRMKPPVKAAAPPRPRPGAAACP